MNHLHKEYLSIISQTPSNVTSSPITVWNPIIGPAVGSLITVVLGGVFVKLWWDLKSTESRALQAEKELDVTKIASDYNSQLKDKDLEIKSKDLEIKALNADIAKLKLETPERMKHRFEIRMSAITDFNEKLEKDLAEAEAALVEKEHEIQRLSKINPDDPLLQEMNVQKQGLILKQEIVGDYLGIVSSFSKRMGYCKSGSIWIDENIQEISNSAVEYVLQNNQQWLMNIAENEKTELINKFKANVRDYLYWVSFCLNRGWSVNLSEINLQPEVPGFALKEAFKFIQREKVSRELVDYVADEIALFINDLIAYFSSSAFH